MGVAAFDWIRWQLSRGLGGRLHWNTQEWLKEKDIENSENYTALFPCGIDAVISSESGYPINKIFLTDMHNLYFSIE